MNSSAKILSNHEGQVHNGSMLKNIHTNVISIIPLAVDWQRFQANPLDLLHRQTREHPLFFFSNKHSLKFGRFVVFQNVLVGATVWSLVLSGAEKKLIQ